MAKKLNKQEIDAILRKVNSIIIEKVTKYNDSIFETIPSPLTEDVLKNVDAKYVEYQAILEQKKELDSKLTYIYNDLKNRVNTLFPNTYVSHTYVQHNNNSFTRETILQYEKQYKRNYCAINNIKLATVPPYTDILDEIIINSSGEVSEIIDTMIKKFSPDEKNN